MYLYKYIYCRINKPLFIIGFEWPCEFGGKKYVKTIPCWYKKLCSHQEPYNSRQTLIKTINKLTCLCYWYLLIKKILCEICLYFVSEGETFTNPPTLVITTHNFRMTPLYRSPNPPVQWQYLTQICEATEAKPKWAWAIPYLWLMVFQIFVKP